MGLSQAAEGGEVSLQNLINAMNKASKMTRANYHLTLGELIDRLNKCEPDQIVMFDNGKHPHETMSYRGYYEDLAFSLGEKEIRVSELLKEARDALGREYSRGEGGVKKREFVQAIEIVKRGHADVYDGFVIDRTKDSITLICQGPNDDSPLKTVTFDLEEFTIKPREESEVKHVFDMAMLEVDRKLCTAEFDLAEAKMNKEKYQRKYRQVFK